MDAKLDNAPDHRLERLAFFSDAVFAIAITLLVIEIDVPHLHHSSRPDAIAALVARLPSILGFALSFAVIGRFWIGHHGAIAEMRTFDAKIVWPNIMLLMAIAFMPFATAFMSANITERVPMIFYCGTLSVTGLLSLWVVWIATERAGDSRHLLRRRGLGAALGMSLGLALSFFTQYAFLAFATIPLWPRLLYRKKASTE